MAQDAEEAGDDDNDESDESEGEDDGDDSGSEERYRVNEPLFVLEVVCTIL